MLTLVALALAITVLPSPWGVIAVGTALAVDVVETGALVALTRRRRALHGTEVMVGRVARVVTRIAPEGQVALDGEIWAARSTEVLERGADVIVVATDGLTLVVASRRGSAR